MGLLAHDIPAPCGPCCVPRAAGSAALAHGNNDARDTGPEAIRLVTKIPEFFVARFLKSRDFSCENRELAKGSPQTPVHVLREISGLCNPSVQSIRQVFI